jgi:hypothetical protein
MVSMLYSHSGATPGENLVVITCRPSCESKSVQSQKTPYTRLANFTMAPTKKSLNQYKLRNEIKGK